MTPRRMSGGNVRLHSNVTHGSGLPVSYVIQLLEVLCVCVCFNVFPFKKCYADVFNLLVDHCKQFPVMLTM